MNNKINILLVDDHAVVRAGFKMLLSSYEFAGDIFDVCSGESALREYPGLTPDIVVMDLSMPGIGGLETIRRLKRTHPEAVVLVYSIHDSNIYVEHALQAGAQGYINKNSASEVLAEAIQAVSKGETYAHPSGSVDSEKFNTQSSIREEEKTKSVDSLSPREFDIFCLLAKGLNAREISNQLCLGYKTVANYSTQIKNKLNVNTTVDLTHIAMINGILKI